MVSRPRAFRVRFNLVFGSRALGGLVAARQELHIIPRKMRDSRLVAAIIVVGERKHRRQSKNILSRRGK